VKLWIITCDRCGSECTPRPERQDALDEARKAGWRLGRKPNGNIDLCPRCRAGPCKPRGAVL
jgi:hypothetical protein